MDHFDLELNSESLPSDYGAELVRLDAMLGEELRHVVADSELADRMFAASVEYLPAGAPLRFADHPVVVVQRERAKRTLWARVAVAASLTVLVSLAGRTVLQSNNGAPVVVAMDEPAVMQASLLSPPLPGEVEMLLLDRAPDRRGEEVAYLFDPDPRQSSDMSLYVQTRSVTMDDVSDELAMLETELRM